jgi:hypothetical protein
MTVRLVKQDGPAGLPIHHLERFVPVDVEIIRGQMKELEGTKYIKRITK